MKYKFLSVIFLSAFFLFFFAGLGSASFQIVGVQPVGSCFDDDLGVIRDNCDLDVDLTVKNRLSYGVSMKVELGIYKTNWLKQSGYSPFAMVSDLPNCVEGEDNVDTKGVSLDGGEVATVRFNIRVPDASDELDRSYSLGFSSFLNCYEYGVDTGVSDEGYVGVTLIDSRNWFERNSYFLNRDRDDRLAGTCFDNQMNQDETDIDCGGSCIGCEAGFMCNANSDCLDDLRCVSGRCKPFEDMSGSEKVVNSVWNTLIVVGVWLLFLGLFGLILFGGWYLVKKLGVL